MFQERLRALTRDTLRGMRRGIEKESLRTPPRSARRSRTRTSRPTSASRS
jgi:hypothetical protein